MIESEETEPKCVFEGVLKTCSEDKTFAEKCLTVQRIQSFIERSKERADGFYSIVKTEDRHYRYHKSCYSTYTSKKVIEKCNNAKRKSMQSPLGSPIGSPTGSPLGSPTSTKKICLRSRYIFVLIILYKNSHLLI